MMCVFWFNMNFLAVASQQCSNIICLFSGKLVNVVKCNWSHFENVHLKLFIALFCLGQIATNRQSTFEKFSPFQCCCYSEDMAIMSRLNH